MIMYWVGPRRISIADSLSFAFAGRSQLAGNCQRLQGQQKNSKSFPPLRLALSYTKTLNVHHPSIPVLVDSVLYT